MPSTESKDTEAFGERLGRNLKGGEVIELVSDLGGGKTTLVRGLVRGAGSTAVVASPTFTISKLYPTPQFVIHHFDFYRLPEAGLMVYELQDTLSDPQAVLIIEWGEVVQHVLPAERLTIHISKTGETDREIKCSYPPVLEYLVTA